MKILRRDRPTRALAKFIFCAILSLIFTFFNRLDAKEFDCDQFLGIFAIAFSNHRIDFSNEQIFETLKLGVSKTLRDIDKNGKLFTKEEVLSILSSITPENFAICDESARIESLYNSKSSKRITQREVLEIEMSNILNSMDPHSSFFSKNKWESFSARIEGRTKGLGITFSVTDGLTYITSVIKGSPSDGILIPGDILSEINGFSTKGLSENNISNLLKSIEETAILVVKRGEEKLTFEIEKREFKVPSVGWKIADEDKGIIYLKLTQFSAGSAVEIKNALKKADEDIHIKGLILDLRYNPGGLVNEAKDIGSFFLDKTVFASIATREGNNNIEITEFHELLASETPIVVLINNYSASASELLSISLKDYERAIIMGTASFGKGTGQAVLDPGSLSKYLNNEIEVAMTLTTFQFYSPFGNSPQKYGVTPHILVKDKNLETYISESIAKAKKLGKKAIVRESDYENALPVNKSDIHVALGESPTNDIEEIVDSISNEIPVIRAEVPEIPELEDEQYERAVKYLGVYTDRCNTYHRNTCNFMEGPYALNF